MRDYREIAWLMEKIIHKYNQFEKMPQKYCDGIMLTQSEIHTVAIIGDEEGINVTELAAKRGITKGAASQMIYRLVDKGLVEKRVSPKSDAALNLYLTELGERARSEHRKMHETTGEKFATFMEQVPDDKFAYMLEFLKAFDEELEHF